MHHAQAGSVCEVPRQPAQCTLADSRHESQFWVVITQAVMHLTCTQSVGGEGPQHLMCLAVWEAWVGHWKSWSNSDSCGLSHCSWGEACRCWCRCQC